ncbi:MAG: hypothetical protein HY815_13730 [Candidatus Riflebacteria bacterium]|nr:hypothetical protein [Candidatus Riflebacteria bacterium]
MSGSTDLTCVLMLDPAAELVKPGHQFKAVFNERGIVVAPGSSQHNTLRAPGICYEHDHKGNALAAMIYAGRLEIRGHSAFPPERVRGLLVRISRLPGLVALRGLEVLYRGQRLGRFGDLSQAAGAP